MVTCLSINNTKFQPGGSLYDILMDPLYPTNQWLLCPNSSTIDYNGFVGTNLWVIPKGDMTNQTLSTEIG